MADTFPADAEDKAEPAPDAEQVAILAALAAALPDPVIAVGTEDRVLVANSAARALFPALRERALLQLAIRSPVVLDAIATARANNSGEKVCWLEKAPYDRLFDVHAAPVSSRDLPGIIVVTLKDLTEARRVERMRVDFVSNASHELRTPLASLLGFIETLQGPARDDPHARVRFLEIMCEQARRMARLVDDLLSLSRIEQNEHLRPETPVDLAAIARHVADTFGPVAAEAGVALQIDAPAEAIVPGDRDELIRVAENLIENAIKYGGSGADPRVEVRVALAGGNAVLTVRDHGPGIPPEHLPRLTERFYRVDAGQSRAKGGTGLGLAIVKHIMARHRGRLRIESEPGKGASFIAAMPAWMAE